MREVHSQARLDGVCDYRLWTTEELIEAYAFEGKRLNKTDAKQTKNLIKKELRRRFNETLTLLDDEQTTENPTGTYLHLLNTKK